MKLQEPNFKTAARRLVWMLDVGCWSFSGAWMLVLGALLLCSAPDVRAQWFDQGAVLTATEENDAVGGTDRHYTQGLKFSYLVADNSVPDWVRKISDVIPTWGFSQHAIKFGTELGQSMYTPANLRTTQVVTNDRPYAGWLYTGFILQRRGLTSGQRPVLENFQLDIGIVGQGSLAESAQKWTHANPPKGWGNQLDTEPGFALKYMRAWLFSPQREGPRIFDVIPHAGFSLGNIDTSFRAGGTLRLGINLPDDFGAQTINSLSTTEGGFSPNRKGGSWGFYVFGGAEGRAVAYNEFLDGNLFRSSHHVTHEPLVGELKAGAVLVSPRVDVGAMCVWQTEEFTKQSGGDLYGTVFVKVKL